MSLDEVFIYDIKIVVGLQRPRAAEIHPPANAVVQLSGVA